MKKKLKPKKSGYGLEFKAFEGEKSTYIVFRTPDGAFHVFSEIEATQAARDCGFLGRHPKPAIDGHLKTGHRA